MTTTDRLAAEPAPRKPLPAVRFGRLSALAPVGLRAEACLHLHKPYVGCRRCASACPHGCLALADGKLELDATQCIGCGLCAANCPTGALAVDGFSFDDVEAGQPLTIACRKSSPAAGATRVPCLGGIGLVTWLALTRHAAGAPIRVLDDGMCRDCPTARSHGNPARGFLALAEETLLAAQVAAGCIPSLQGVVSLPNGNAATHQSETAGAPSRRAFFSGLGRAVSAGVARKAGSAAPMVDLAAVPKQPRDAVPYSSGHEIRLTMMQFADRQGVAPSTAHLAHVAVDNACRGHAGCTRLCPTGALHSLVDGNDRVLAFDAWLCIDCTACVDACPEKALQYEAPQWREFTAGAVVLARLRQAECSRCGEHFAAADGGDLCPVCRRSAALSRAGFALFAGLRGGIAIDTGPP